MKRMGIIAAFFAVLFLAACSDSVDLVQVRIPLPGAANARAVGLADAQKHANFFEAAIRNKATGAVFSANAPITRGYIDVSIPPGIYDILLFAGDNTRAPALPLLLASSHAQDVDIVAGQTNDVYMTLVTFDIDLINPPSQVMLKETFSAGFVVNTRNPLITPSVAGAFPHRDSVISIGGVTRDLKDDGWYYDSGTNIYTYTETVSFPTAGNAAIGFAGNIGMFGESTPVWAYMDFGHTALGDHFQKEVTVIDNTDVNIILGWEGDGVARIGTTEFPTLLAAINTATRGTASPTEIVLLKDITVPEKGMVSETGYEISGKNIKLTVEEGKSRTITASPGNFTLFTVKSGASLTLKGNGSATLTLDGIDVTSGLQPQRRAVYINDSSLTLADNAFITRFINSSVDDGGAGVYVTNNGSFYMTGGKIHNNQGWHDGNPNSSGRGGQGGGGGTVFIKTNGTFIMSGGIIENNKANGGGAVFVKGGSFIMEDGILQGNRTNNGGAVYITTLYSESDSAVFMMKGGTIQGNTAQWSGGGVYIDFGTFNYAGGKIYGSNTGTGLANIGGAVSVTYDGLVQYVDSHPNAGTVLIRGTGFISNTIE